MYEGKAAIEPRWAIAFVDEGEIGMLHEQFLGDPSPTDILTFPYEDPDIFGGRDRDLRTGRRRQRHELGNSL